VACFWATSFEKNLSAVAVRHHLFSCRWQHHTTHNIVEGLEVRGLVRGRSKIGHGASRFVQCPGCVGGFVNGAAAGDALARRQFGAVFDSTDQ
jgi:hypothetical protein